MVCFLSHDFSIPSSKHRNNITVFCTLIFFSKSCEPRNKDFLLDISKCTLINKFYNYCQYTTIIMHIVKKFATKKEKKDGESEGRLMEAPEEVLVANCDCDASSCKIGITTRP